jgi:glycosyltransferase involved in cell wall biosynthesis
MSWEPRVLHVAQPTTAGVSHVVEALARDQVAQDWRVHVACPSDGYLADRAAAAGVEVHTWEATREPGTSFIRETAALSEIVSLVEPEVVHLHSSKAGLCGRLALRGRTPTVFQPHSWSFLAVKGSVRTAARVWEGWASRWASAVICVSDDEARQGRAAGVRSDIHVIPNGIDVAHDVHDHPAAARAHLGVPDAPTAVCLGRLARQKGQDRLLRIWPEVRRAVPDARLVLVGDGPDRVDLEAATRRTGGVWLVGHQDDVTPWLAIGDVVVLPSRWEAGLTLAAMEAMAVGRSVVATRFEGVTSGLPDGAGEVVAQDDDGALCAALVARLLRPDIAQQEGAAGRRFVMASRRLSTATAAVRSVYADVAPGLVPSGIL